MLGLRMNGFHPAFLAKDECAKTKSPEPHRIQAAQHRAYVSHILDIRDKNKKSERRPHRNEVRISQFWRVRPKKIADESEQRA